MHNINDKSIDDIADEIINDYKSDRDIDILDENSQPDRTAVRNISRDMLSICFPGYYKNPANNNGVDEGYIKFLINKVYNELCGQVSIALRFLPEYKDTGKEIPKDLVEGICKEFIVRIPEVREYCSTDLEAIFDGDPAAFNHEEIILSYPGFMAIALSRIAHILFSMNVPMIPRMITEYAHSRTGIDIHPGATIGKYFCIDHGTGIVIGETSEIGEHVKVYQGVTIGALSTRGGQKLRGKKRHPTIGDFVTIYSGASILGGDTVIGKCSVIGSNVFITRSVDPGTRVCNKGQELDISKRFCPDDPSKNW